MFSSMLALIGSLRSQLNWITKSLQLTGSPTNSFLRRVPTTAGSSTTFTYSGWVRRSVIGSGHMIFGCSITEGQNYSVINFNPSNQLQFNHVFGGVTQWSLGTTQTFAANTWYHIVAVGNTTNPTVADRIRLYVNGVRITSFSSNISPLSGATSYFNNAFSHQIGKYVSSQYFNGYMAEINWLDGQALDPSYFGQLIGGTWKAKKYTGTYSANSFYLDFKDATDNQSLGLDVSGLSNNYETVAITPANQSTIVP